MDLGKINSWWPFPPIRSFYFISSRARKLTVLAMTLNGTSDDTKLPSGKKQTITCRMGRDARKDIEVGLPVKSWDRLIIILPGTKQMFGRCQDNKQLTFFDFDFFWERKEVRRRRERKKMERCDCGPPAWKVFFFLFCPEDGPVVYPANTFDSSLRGDLVPLGSSLTKF